MQFTAKLCCSSADMAVACRAPVLIVGKSGVGDAIDSFNLCARFFEARRVPVLGVVFNKLPPKGFYGLAACEEYVRKYMRTSRPKQHVYGLLPASDLLAALAEHADKVHTLGLESVLQLMIKSLGDGNKAQQVGAFKKMKMSVSMVTHNNHD